MDIYEDIRRNILEGNAKRVKMLVEKAIALKYPAESILKDGLILGIEMLSYKFRESYVSVPEALVSTRALNMGLKTVAPYLKTKDKTWICRAIIGTVEGDLHDIGKNLVKTYVSTLDIEVIDLGVDVSKEEFAEAVRTYKPQIVMISSLLLTTLDEIKNVIDELKRQNLRDDVVVFVGGMPVTPEFAKEAGADYYSKDALELRNFLDKNIEKILKVKKSNR